MNEELLTDTESGDAAIDETPEVAPTTETEHHDAEPVPAASDDNDDTVDARRFIHHLLLGQYHPRNVLVIDRLGVVLFRL